MTSEIFSMKLKNYFPECVSGSCKAEQCELKLDGFPKERVILNVDNIKKPKQLGRRCDYVVIVDESNRVFFLPIEFKSSKLDLTKIKAQLESTILFFKKHLPNQLALCPVLVSKNLRPQERKLLSKIKIESSFGDKLIRHVRCNHYLEWSQVKGEKF